MITVVINSLGRGGAELSIMLLVQELNRMGQAAQIVCLFTDPVEHEVPSDLAGAIVRLNARSMAQAVWRLYGHLRSRRPEQVYALMPQSNLAAVLCSRLLRLPVITSERTTPTLLYDASWKLFTALLPHALSDRAVFISRYALERGVPTRFLGALVRRNACVLLNPVSPLSPIQAGIRERPARIRRLRAALEGGDPVRLLIASRLHSSKGHRQFLAQASNCLRSGAIKLVIASEGAEASAVAADIARLGLGDHVTMGGFFTDMASIYAETDILVLSALTEGFGRVGFEAYQSGCLILGVPENSFQSEVLDETPAWKVIPDFTHLEDGLRQLLSSEIPVDGSDIAAMSAALAPRQHAEAFLDIVRAVRC